MKIITLTNDIFEYSTYYENLLTNSTVQWESISDEIIKFNSIFKKGEYPFILLTPQFIHFDHGNNNAQAYQPNYGYMSSQKQNKSYKLLISESIKKEHLFKKMKFNSQEYKKLVDDYNKFLFVCNTMNLHSCLLYCCIFDEFNTIVGIPTSNFA